MAEYFAERLGHVLGLALILFVAVGIGACIDNVRVWLHRRFPRPGSTDKQEQDPWNSSSS